jgi:drug/metabolite transporter (DMT)-like permease
MPILIAILKHFLDPYWDTLKKRLAQDNIASITIAHTPNLVGHPIGIAVLFACGMFVLPHDPKFFLFWFAMIGIASIVSIFVIWGLLETKFFAVQVVSSLGFAASSLFAVLILGEHLSSLQITALVVGIIGVIIFVWPKKQNRSLHFDKGLLFVILAVILGGLSSVFYKLASFHVSSYTMFLSGRFIGDFIGWTITWFISLAILKRNPVREVGAVMTRSYGIKMILGLVTFTLVGSWLFYKLPVTTLAMLGTLSFPASYFWSQIKYREHITLQMWCGTIFIIGSVVLFLI